jgi:transcriptional regulator with XRE-family HTH domain
MNPIRTIRQALGWSQDQLGLVVGASGSRISRLERGFDSLRAHQAEAIARVSDWLPAKLIEEHESFRRSYQAQLISEAQATVTADEDQD